MSKKFEKFNFIWLTVALVGLMITGAVSREISSHVTVQILETSGVVLLLVSLLSLRTSRQWLKWFILIIGCMLAMVVVREFSSHSAWEYAYLALLLVFLLLAAWLVASNVLFTGTVDFNKVVGSIALYLMLGLIFSIFYTILLEFSPEAIKGFEAQAWYDNMPAMTYFSFVTLTTLGYGDMSPANYISEVIVILEAVTGMFYLAIIVASLISAMRVKPRYKDQ
jgi:hypothetical protein